MVNCGSLSTSGMCCPHMLNMLPLPNRKYVLGEKNDGGNMTMQMWMVICVAAYYFLLGAVNSRQ